MKAKSWHIALMVASYLGSFSAAGASVWRPDWSNAKAGALPSDLEVTAVAPSSEYQEVNDRTVAAFVEVSGRTSPLVLALKDRSSSDEVASASVAREGFQANRAKLGFQFYTTTAHRNGNLLVRLLNREGECLASFTLFAKQHELGEIGLNTFATPSERQMPGDANVYEDRTWTTVLLDYDGLERKWSLTIGERTYRDLSVDALVLDPAVARFEIHTGFGKANNTQLYVDELFFETLE